MASDCFVPFRSEEDIAAIAAKARKFFNIGNVDKLDVLGLIRKYTGKVFGDRGVLFLEIFSGLREDNFAYVTFEPLTIHIEEETWDHAEMGDEYSRYVIAHELGHAVLHDKTAKKFSSKLEQFGTFGMEEHSAEWQAHTFADYLLSPDAMVLQFRDMKTLALHAGMPSARCAARLSSVRRRRLDRVSTISGSEDSCASCGNLSLKRSGLLLQCEFCKESQLN